MIADHEFQSDVPRESHGPAVILQHRSAPVKLDPPILTEEQMQTLEASEAVVRLAELLGGYKRMARIVRTMATIHGEEV